MQTPYAKHTFGEKVARRLMRSTGWLNAGVASSIPWPSHDVCIEYSGDEYILRGTDIGKDKPGPPCISVPCRDGGVDEAISKVYKFTSILGWFKGGYVDVSGYGWGSQAFRYGDGGRTIYSDMGIAGRKSFSCNHMPVIESENIRKALAFWREGKRLKHVHASYAFLSYFKVIESQFLDKKSETKKRIAWIDSKIDQLTDKASNRVNELKEAGLDVSKHLYQSGRCAVAHASLEGVIVDPDIPDDRRRLSSDLVIMEELARIYIRDELNIPDEMAVYKKRNRLEPWSSLLKADELAVLKDGGNPKDPLNFDGHRIAVGMWPDGVMDGLDNMTLNVQGLKDGIVKIALLNERQTICLIFYLDYVKGEVQSSLEEGWLDYDNESLSENDVRAYWTYFYRTVCNGIAELVIDGIEPIDCEIVIPTNMMMRGTVEEAVEVEISRFRNDWPSYNLRLASGDEWTLSTKKLDKGFRGVATFANDNGTQTKIYGSISKNQMDAIRLIAELIERKYDET